MPLVDLKTDLTSLKFGKDRPGGGSSREPFIKGKSLNKRIAEDGIETLASTGGTDMFIRGGGKVVSSTAKDLERLGKYFTTTEGLAFIAQQNLLSLSGVRIYGGYPDLVNIAKSFSNSILVRFCSPLSLDPLFILGETATPSPLAVMAVAPNESVMVNGPFDAGAIPSLTFWAFFTAPKRAPTPAPAKARPKIGFILKPLANILPTAVTIDLLAAKACLAAKAPKAPVIAYIATSDLAKNPTTEANISTIGANIVPMSAIIP